MKRRIVLEVDDAVFHEQLVNGGYVEISPVEFYLMPRAELSIQEKEFASEIGEFGITIVSDEELA